MSTRIQCCAVAIFIAAILSPLGISAQRFVNVSAEHPFGTTHEVFQDRDGFLWVGSLQGLYRYDGYSTELYTHDPNDPNSLTGNNINSIGQDPLGRMWVGLSTYGLNVLDTNYQRFKPICITDENGDCLTEFSVNTLTLDSLDNMWVGTSVGLYVLTTGGEPEVIQRFHYDPEDSLSLISGYGICAKFDSRGRYWYGSANGINLYNPNIKGFVNARTNASFPTRQILSITENSKGDVYITPRFGPVKLMRYNEDSNSFDVVPGFDNMTLGELKATFDSNDIMWITSRGAGAYRVDFENNSRQHFKNAGATFHGYRTIYGMRVFPDSYGNIWFTGSDLIKWPGTNKEISQLRTFENPVISVYADDEKIWFCSNIAHRFSRNELTTSTYIPEGYPSNPRTTSVGLRETARVYSFSPLNEDQFLFATTRNVFLWNRHTDQFREYALNYGGPFRSIIPTLDKNGVWICGNQGTPTLLDLITGDYHRPEYASSIVGPRYVDRDPDGNLWFGTTANGVFKLDITTREVIHFSPDHEDPARRLSDYATTYVKCGEDEYVWIGTGLGVNRINRKTNDVFVYRKQPGLPNESISSIEIDKSNNIWLSTQNGISKLDLKQNTFTNFNNYSGLLNKNYVGASSYQDEHGVLYFGGHRGIDFFHPDSLGQNMIPPDLVLAKIYVNNQVYDSSRAAHQISTINVSYDQNFIELELSAIHLTAPGGNKYAYRIRGLQDDWIELGTNRTITLSNARHGTYFIEAKASNADDIWSEPEELITIVINPPYWAMWWFRGLIVFMIASILYLVYRARVRRVRDEERLKAGFNRRIAELESKALRAQMNPHFLFNSLNSMKSLISQGENAKATQYITRFSKLIRQVLANSEKQLVRLQEELEALRLYLDIEQLRFQNFEYSINVHEGVDTDFVEVPPLILQPYVENAIWHGLMHKTSGSKSLAINVEHTNDFLILTIEDNGIGRDKAAKLKMRGSARHGGMGMRLTGDRLSLLQHTYGLNASVEVKDLRNPQNEATGTRVIVRIPYLG